MCAVNFAVAAVDPGVSVGVDVVVEIVFVLLIGCGGSVTSCAASSCLFVLESLVLKLA